MLSGCLGLAWVLDIQERNILELLIDPPFGKLWLSFLILFSLEMALDFTLHCIFVVKYWVAGQKVKMCMTTRIDPNFDFKVKVLFFSLLILIYASLGVNSFAYWNPVDKGPGWFTKNMVWLGLAVCLPAFLFFILLAHAF
jgi:hypothetical protein